MKEWWRSIHVNVVDDEIIVSLPGTTIEAQIRLEGRQVSEARKLLRRRAMEKCTLTDRAY